jgi:hypothetical protein
MDFIGSESKRCGIIIQFFSNQVTMLNGRSLIGVGDIIDSLRFVWGAIIDVHGSVLDYNGRKDSP